jgi:nucleotide-binding universal stress UspA family protein
VVDGGHQGRAAMTAAEAVQRAGDRARWEVTSGTSPAEGILAAAERLDGPLVVVGQPRSGGWHAALGSVVREVVRHSRHPILVVPA